MIRFAAVMAFLLMLGSGSAFAVDNGGFGAPFTKKAPAALGGDASTAIAAEPAAPADIEPAAGMTLDQAPNNGDIKTEEEKELEKRFDTNVERTTFDRGADSTQTHDRMGDGKVGVYYGHKKDEQSDTIGVDVKLMEFK